MLILTPHCCIKHSRCLVDEDMILSISSVCARTRCTFLYIHVLGVCGCTHMWRPKIGVRNLSTALLPYSQVQGSQSNPELSEMIDLASQLPLRIISALEAGITGGFLCQELPSSHFCGKHDITELSSPSQGDIPELTCEPLPG